MLPPDPASQIKSQTEKMNQILLALSDAKSPYKEIGKIYEALIKTSSSDKQSALKFTDLNLLSENSGSGESLYDEFGWLVVARSKIDDAASYSDGRNLLKLLAEKGQVAHVASAVTLARISETKEERAEAVGVLESLKNRVPEQSPIIDVELEKISS